MLCEDLFAACLECVRKVLSDAAVEYVDISSVLLVGGASRMPRLCDLLRELLAGVPIDQSMNPEESVALGCALEAFKSQYSVGSVTMPTGLETHVFVCLFVCCCCCCFFFF
jgi:molecular chaperone DnaK (HSP70)